MRMSKESLADVYVPFLEAVIKNRRTIFYYPIEAEHDTFSSGDGHQIDISRYPGGAIVKITSGTGTVDYTYLSQDNPVIQIADVTLYVQIPVINPSFPEA